MFQKKLFLLFTLLLTTYASTSIAEPTTTHKSQKTISGRVLDYITKAPIQGSCITLWADTGQTHLRTAYTDADGFYLFDDIEDGKYRIQGSMRGYATSQMMVVSPNTSLQEEIYLRPPYTTLEDIVINPDVTDIQTQAEKRIVRVGADLNTSANAAKDLMNNLPSCIVDVKGDIMLRGSKNVRFFIDGRPTNLNSKELLNILPTSSIVEVELITSPSSKEYPDGPSGIINFVTKRSSKKGFGGAVDLSYGTGEKYNAALNLNYRGEKVNVWGAYTFFQNKSILEGLVEKTDISSSPTLSRQKVSGHYLGNMHEIKYGLDYDISTRTQLSYMGATRIIWRESDMNISSNTYTDLSESRCTSAYQSNALSSSHMTFVSNGLHLRHSFDSKNRIDADINYEIDNNGNNTLFAQEFTTKMSPFMPNNVADTSGYESNYTYLTARVDYKHSDSRYTVETGVNLSLRTMDNPYHSHSVTYMPRPIPAVTSSSSYHFRYAEDIYALYATYSRHFGAFTAKAGIRADISKTTVKNLAQEAGQKDDVFTSDTVNFYPSAHLSYRINDKNRLMLSYSRRVARPSTDQINPNAVSTNPANPTIGNPYISPEYSNTVELTYTGSFRKINLSASAYWIQNRDVIQSYITPINPVTGQSTPGVTYNTFKNYDRAYQLGSEVILSAEATNWLGFSFSGNVYYVDYSVGEGKTWNKSGINFSSTASANAKITPQLSAMLMGRYTGSQTYIQGVEEPCGVMDAGLKYDMFDKKLSVSARVTDLLNSYKSVVNSTIETTSGTLQHQSDREMYDTRVFYLSLSYRF